MLEPSVAVIDTFVLYVPAFKPARFAATVIGTDWLLAASKPDAGDNVNQLAGRVIVACQLKGQAQLPLAVIESVCGAGLLPPCVALLKATETCEGC